MKISQSSMFKDIPPDGITVTSPIPNMSNATAKYDLTMTVLDKRLNSVNSFVKLPKGILLVSPKVNQLIGDQNWRTYQTIVKRLKFKGYDPSQFIHEVKDEQGIILPKGISNTYDSVGKIILSPLQICVDRLITLCNSYTRNVINQMRIQHQIFVYASTIQNELLGKGGLIDNSTGCVHPCSGRGVISANPRISIDTVILPEFMVRRWIRNPEVIETYGLTGDEEMDLMLMKNQLVVTGRFPIHDRGSLVALKLNYHRSPVILINPVLIAAIWQGKHRH